jgi:hypothetical protein
MYAVQKRRKFSYYMPLALAYDRQLKNFIDVIPADQKLDSALLVEFILDFRRVGTFRTNQDLIAQELQLMMKAVKSTTIGEKECLSNCTVVC